MNLTAAQIASYAAGAGFPSAQIPTAVAVALAESDGNPNNLGDTSIQTAKWGPSVGLWQVRSLKPAALAKAEGADTYRDAGKLTDPTYNAAAARAIWGESGWSPWSTYTSGAFLLRLPAARAAAKAPAAVSSSTTSAGTSLGSIQPAGLGDLAGEAGGLLKYVSPLGLPLGLLGDPGDMFGAAKQAVGLLGNLVAFLAKAAVWLADPGNWLRIVKVWAGTWLVILGLGMAAWPALSPIVNTAANVVPAGKVAKAAGAARAAKGAAAAAAV